MIKINLLPQIRKEEIKWRKIAQFVIFYGASILIMLGILTVFLFAVQIFLQSEVASLDKKIQLNQKSAKTQELKALEAKVKVFNEKVSMLDKIQIEHVYFSKILEECAEITPEGIQLSVFDIQSPCKISADKEIKSKDFENAGQKENLRKVNIAGKAKTRKDILAFKDVLEESGNFQDLYLPLANLTERYDIEFSFNGLLKEEALRKY